MFNDREGVSTRKIRELTENCPGGVRTAALPGAEGIASGWGVTGNGLYRKRTGIVRKRTGKGGRRKIRG